MSIWLLPMKTVHFGLCILGARVQRMTPFEEELNAARNISGLYLPWSRGAAGVIRSRAPATILPPPELRHFYGLKDGHYDDDLYLSSGANDAKIVRRILCQDGVDLSAAPFLDFGCSAGRVLRHFAAEAKQAEFWGVDIHAEAISWAQDHLAPPFHFVTTTTAPHLPFADETFGVVFAGSVFTHLAELADAWFLELRRVLRAGGRLYVTISDEGTLAQIAETQPNHPSNSHIAALRADDPDAFENWQALYTRQGAWAQRSVYRRATWTARMSRWMAHRSTHPCAYGWQTAVVFAKEVR